MKQIDRIHNAQYHTNRNQEYEKYYKDYDKIWNISNH